MEVARYATSCGTHGSWVDTIRRATAAVGIDPWEVFVAKGIKGGLEPENLNFEKAVV